MLLNKVAYIRKLPQIH